MLTIPSCKHRLRLQGLIYGSLPPVLILRSEQKSHSNPLHGAPRQRYQGFWIRNALSDTWGDSPCG